MATDDRIPVAGSQRFPFDVQFQKSLLRLIAEDDSFGAAAIVQLQPSYFETEILGWVFGFMRRFFEAHAAVPSMAAIAQEVYKLDSTIRPIYGGVVHEIQQSSLRDEVWLRDATLDFVKRNVFVRAFHEGRQLYNEGKTVEAYDLMMEQMDELSRVAWEPVDVSWHFDELQKRHTQRILAGPEQGAIPTGFPSLDHILNGGLHPGELGIWLAYPKIGKTTLLVVIGIAACRRQFKVLHIVLEGSKALIQDRYDSSFTREAYHAVKTGRMDPREYALALKEYEYLKGTCVIRSFVDKWDVSILDIDAELRRLERNHGWRPDLLIIDYADLMTGRHPELYRSETQSQRAAYRDVKRLTSRQYAIWTASQATRPNTKQMEEQHILYSNSVADTYEKVRAADFLGSLNQTPDEKNAKTMRLYHEMYRSNAAGQMASIYADSENMQMYEDPRLAPQEPASSNGGQLHQMRAL